MHPPRRVQRMRRAIDVITKGLEPVVDLWQPYVDGLENLPEDGRFLIVGNHTMSGVEGTLIPHVVRRAIGSRVRPLTERMMGRWPLPARDALAAYGGVIGTPDNARELMRHDQTILVFPGGGREMTKFKGEEYQLRWHGRFGFARLAVEFGYPIVTAALVGGDDVYHTLVKRDSRLGRWGLRLTERLIDRRDTPPPLMRGIGPTMIPRPQRMYLRFTAPIHTHRRAGAAATDWVTTVKDRAQHTLETALAELQEIRSDDPYRRLNPLARADAVQPA